MYIKKVKIKNFRNYIDETVEFNKNVNLIIGNNAQGKTNLIESLYLSSFGKSFRTTRDGDLIKFGEKSASVEIISEDEQDENTIEIKIRKPSKKSIIMNGLPLKRTSELLRNIYIVVFSPEDLKLVKDEPQKRRDFIDREMCQISPKYCSILGDYKKILKQRNAYLKSEKIDFNYLDLWDSSLSEAGASIIKMRQDFIEKISEKSREIHSSITCKKENLRIIYESDIEIMETEKEEQKKFYKILIENRENDIRNGTTRYGPHRDDISFDVNGIDMRKFGSQGQQRTSALSLKLAEIHIIKEDTGEDAVLLLDDVMSELDINRQEYLIKTLKKNQLFITTTEIENDLKQKFENISIFKIENGKVI